MSQPVSRTVVENFYEALANCDVAALAPYLDDDVVWTISGPIDVVQFCGRRSGKDVVLQLLDRDIPLLFEKRYLVPHAMLVDGDHAAVFGKMMTSRRDVDHPISYRIAQFIRFRNEKVVDYVSIIDRFDAVEQLLGQHLTVGGV